jgi:uncharacterized protein YkwD
MNASIKKLVIGAAVAIASGGAALDALALPVPIEGKAVASRIVQETNRYRTAHGVAPVTQSPSLTLAAQQYAELLARNPSPVDVADGKSLHRRLTVPGYNGCAWAETVFESVYRGPEDLRMLAGRAMESLKARPGYAKAMLGTRAQHIGVGVAAFAPGGGVYYDYRIVQVFGRDCAQTKPLPPAACEPGYVYRFARPNDRVCVTPLSRAQIQLDNGEATSRVQHGGGAYGVHTCRAGFVWREAFDGDLVCVTPGRRAAVRQENQLAALRTR